MAATSTSETWDAAWTLTLRKNRKRLTDNIFDEYPVLAALRKSGKVEIEDGGKEFQEDVMYAKNTGTWFSGYDTVGTAAVDGITAAFYVPRYISVPVTISMTEEVESNAVGSKKLMEAKQDQTMLTARDSVSSAMFGATSGKIMLGLQDLVADTPTTGTVGGINRASNTWWRNKANTSSTDVDSKSGDFYAGLTGMSSLWNDCSEGNETPTDIFTTLTIFGDLQEIFESTGYARLEAGTRGAADAGMPNFRGATVRYDRDCASQHLYMLNDNYIKMKIQANKNFAKTPFKEPVNQFAKVAFVVLGCQLVINNPRRLGVATTFT